MKHNRNKIKLTKKNIRKKDKKKEQQKQDDDVDEIIKQDQIITMANKLMQNGYVDIYQMDKQAIIHLIQYNNQQNDQYNNQQNDQYNNQQNDQYNNQQNDQYNNQQNDQYNNQQNDQYNINDNSNSNDKIEEIRNGDSDDDIF